MKLKTFKVRGSYPFPFDMLRYDMCWPATQQDALEIEKVSEDGRLHVVTLETLSGNLITAPRWESFFWEVQT